MGDRIVVLDRGHVGQIDVPGVVYNQPASANVAKYLNCYNLFGGRIGPGQFVADGHGFALPARKTASADVAYAIRQDLIETAPLPPEHRKARVETPVSAASPLPALPSPPRPHRPPLPRPRPQATIRPMMARATTNHPRPSPRPSPRRRELRRRTPPQPQRAASPVLRRRVLRRRP